MGGTIHAPYVRFPPIADTRSVRDSDWMSLVFTQLDTLVGALGRRVAHLGIIGIDGWTGVGKTTLAAALATALDGSSYDLDRALTHDQRRYVSALRLPEISEALAHSPRPLFVSGICLLEVLAKAGASLDAHIYVKRLATWGWADEDELTGTVPEVPGASGELVRQELRNYHHDWKPHLVCDYEFQRLG